MNAQELRNCLYAGSFNELLINNLSREPLFTTVWNIPPYDQHSDRHGNVDESLRKNPLYRRMIDCELVLRFFAFRKRSNIKGSVRSMLDRCMVENMNAKEPEIETFTKDFKSRLKLAHDIFGQRVFRYKNEKGELEVSQPLYDGVMVALDRLWDSRAKLISAKTRVVEKVERLLRNEAKFEIIVGKPNTARAVQERMDLLTKAIKSAI